jgi:hypothetical protein
MFALGLLPCWLLLGAWSASQLLGYRKTFAALLHTATDGFGW